jgi:hypothetical protein
MFQGSDIRVLYSGWKVEKVAEGGEIAVASFGCHGACYSAHHFHLLIAEIAVTVVEEAVLCFQQPTAEINSQPASPNSYSPA